MYKLSVYILVLFGIMFHNSLGYQDHWRERAGPVNVLSVPVFSTPEVCRVPDFTSTCHVRDQVCKTRKEKCGDAMGTYLNDELLSLQNGFQNMRLHNGKYDSIHGIDEYRSVEKGGKVSHHFSENKAHTSQLDRRRNQGGNDWHGDRLDRAYEAGNLPSLEYTQAKQALEYGNVTRAVIHTTLAANDNRSPYFKAIFKPIISNVPERREAELQTYCRTIHPPVMQLSHQYSHYQTTEQRNNLTRLDSECQQLTPPTTTAYMYAEPSANVCFVRHYDRDNLYKLLNFLHGQGYSYANIANGSPVSGSTIGNLIKNRNHALSQNYKGLWNHLEVTFSEEFALWTTIPYSR